MPCTCSILLLVKAANHVAMWCAGATGTRPPRQRKHSLVELAHKVTTAPPASTLRESTALRIDKCHGGMFINQYLVTKFLVSG